MSPLPAYGSLYAYDALVKAFVGWRLAQQACDARPDVALDAWLADEAWADLKRHAVNCGWDKAKHPSLSAWAPRTVTRWGRMCGRTELEIAITLGPEATDTISSIGRD